MPRISKPKLSSTMHHCLERKGREGKRGGGKGAVTVAVAVAVAVAVTATGGPGGEGGRVESSSHSS